MFVYIIVILGVVVSQKMKRSDSGKQPSKCRLYYVTHSNNTDDIRKGYVDCIVESYYGTECVCVLSMLIIIVYVHL